MAMGATLKEKMAKGRIEKLKSKKAKKEAAQARVSSFSTSRRSSNSRLSISVLPKLHITFPLLTN